MRLRPTRSTRRRFHATCSDVLRLATANGVQGAGEQTVSSTSSAAVSGVRARISPTPRTAAAAANTAPERKAGLLDRVRSPRALGSSQGESFAAEHLPVQLG